MKKILIVDDNPQNLYMLEIMLLSNGYQVEKAVNGKEGLEYANQAPPDMVISDILMPTMDGFSFCRAWKTSSLLKKIPFIFYTATYTDPKDEAFALSLGAERFLIKPLEPVEMLITIKEVFNMREKGEKAATQKPIEGEEEYYKTYSETLVRKLEDKMVQLERANKRLSALYLASCDLVKIKVSKDLIQSVLHTIIETAGYEQVNYFNFDEDQKKLFLSSSVGFSKETATEYKDRLIFNFGDSKGLVGLVAKTEHSINVPDTSKDQRWISLEQSIQSALFVPVHYEKTLLGVVGLFSKEINAFTEMDEHNVASLTNSLAIAIENKRNQERIQKQILRLSALHTIDMAINGNMELRSILKIVIAHVVDQLNIDATDIILFNQYSLTYEVAAGHGFLSRLVENREIRPRTFFAEKAILERRTVHLERLTDPQVPALFASMWVMEGFSTYWGVPLIARGEVKGVLEVFQRSQFTPDSEWLNYLETLAGQAAIAIDSAEMFEGLQHSNIDLKFAYEATIEGWSRAMDLRDKETENHTQRVVEKTLEMGVALGIKNDELVHIRHGALLHDIGKMGVPDGILLKPGKLTPEEWVVMKKHPDFAYEMLSHIPYLHRALDIPWCHHEKWDGSGYPRGLKGEQIPLAARLFAIVDVWDALRSDRPYRKAWANEEVLEYIQKESGKHFDPELVKTFFNLLKKESDNSSPAV
jgi:response regulator RpfG family c-di-GMP phosphodiesterase